LFGNGVDGGFGCGACGGGAVVGGMVAEIVRCVERVDALVTLYK